MDNLSIENARIIYRNFSGKEMKFNRAGDRNFCVVIEDAGVADRLRMDGWNVKILQPRNEEDDPAFYIQVSVSYKIRPPKIFMIAGKHKTALTEETIDALDYADIKTTDLVIRPYEWAVNGKSGIKAYLDALYVTIVEDAFAHKYATFEEQELEDSGDDLPF